MLGNHVTRQIEAGTTWKNQARTAELRTRSTSVLLASTWSTTEECDSLLARSRSSDSTRRAKCSVVSFRELLHQGVSRTSSSLGRGGRAWHSTRPRSREKALP